MGVKFRLRRKFRREASAPFYTFPVAQTSFYANVVVVFYRRSLFLEECHTKTLSRGFDYFIPKIIFHALKTTKTRTNALRFAGFYCQKPQEESNLCG